MFVVCSQEWSAEDVTEAMVWVTSLARQSGQQELCTIIVCQVGECTTMARDIQSRGLYAHVEDAYYCVHNQPQSKCQLNYFLLLPSSIHPQNDAEEYIAVCVTENDLSLSSDSLKTFISKKKKKRGYYFKN